MFTADESAYMTHRCSLYCSYSGNVSVNLKLFLNKKIFKRFFKKVLLLETESALHLYQAWKGLGYKINLAEMSPSLLCLRLVGSAFLK